MHQASGDPDDRSASLELPRIGLWRMSFPKRETGVVGQPRPAAFHVSPPSDVMNRAAGVSKGPFETSAAPWFASANPSHATDPVAVFATGTLSHVFPPSLVLFKAPAELPNQLSPSAAAKAPTTFAVGCETASHVPPPSVDR
jgi:hypothetical protein